MHRKITPPRPTRKPSGTGPLWVVALLACMFVAAMIAVMHDRGPQRRIEIGEPISVTPVVPIVTPVVRPLSLRVDLPELDPDQAYWFRKAQTVTSCPLCTGIDAPPVDLDENARAAWLALIWTESRYQPWAVSDIGCYGLGQLCGALKTQETDERPEWNLYVSAREFARLVDTSADLNEAISSYKGQTTSDTKWQADTVWSYVRVSP